MSKTETVTLSGLLLDWPPRRIEASDLLRCVRLRYMRPIESSNWEEYEYHSPIPLRGEDPSINSGPFFYTLTCRRSGSRILLLAPNKHIAEAVVDTELSKTFGNSLRRVPIAIDALVKAIVDRPTSYVLSFVYARVPAFGAALRSTSFFGDDLGGAALFKDNAHLMNFSTCGLRQAIGGTEIVRLGSDGSISFAMNSWQRLTEVESVLRFLRAEGYLRVDLLESEN